MRKAISLLWILSLLALTSVGCELPSPTPTVLPASATPIPATPDLQATVDASVFGTATAQAGLQATIDASVQATVSVAPPPTPAVETVTLTEEELAALIDSAVISATTTTGQCTTAAAESTADGAVTAEEVAYIYDYYYDAYELIAYALELAYAYEDLYGELAEESLALLQAIEEDLSTLEDSLEAIDAALQEISLALQQGQAAAQETVAKLETAAQNANTAVVEIQTQAQPWLAGLQAEIEARATALLALQPLAVPADRQAAIQSLFDYVDSIRNALADNKLSQAELANIAQLGANAVAGLNAHGGPQLQQLSSSIGELTGQLARGQLPTAKASLATFEAALPQRPARP
jgi:hypothetical protein